MGFIETLLRRGIPVNQIIFIVIGIFLNSCGNNLGFSGNKSHKETEQKQRPNIIDTPEPGIKSKHLFTGVISSGPFFDKERMILSLELKKECGKIEQLDFDIECSTSDKNETSKCNVKLYEYGYKSKESSCKLGSIKKYVNLVLSKNRAITIDHDYYRSGEIDGVITADFYYDHIAVFEDSHPVNDQSMYSSCSAERFDAVCTYNNYYTKAKNICNAKKILGNIFKADRDSMLCYISSH